MEKADIINNRDLHNAPIGILDSGVGGMTALIRALEVMPNQAVIYIGDTKRMPYGNRTPEEIISGANAMISFLEKRGAKMILLACNTISSYISGLTSRVELINIIDSGADFIGDIPAGGAIGVIATVATVKSGSYERAIKGKYPACTVITASSETLPKIIDSSIDDKALISEKIRECIDPILSARPDIKDIILGCSHFPIIKSDIERLYPGINFIDPAKAQAQKAKERLGELGLLCRSDKPASIDLFTTAETYEFAAAIKRLNLEVDSLMKVKLYPED